MYMNERDRKYYYGNSIKTTKNDDQPINSDDNYRQKYSSNPHDGEGYYDSDGHYWDITPEDVEKAKKSLNKLFEQLPNMKQVPRQPADIEEEFSTLINEMYEYVGAKVGAGQLTESAGQELIDLLDARIIRPTDVGKEKNPYDSGDNYEDDRWTASTSCW